MWKFRGKLSESIDYTIIDRLVVHWLNSIILSRGQDHTRSWNQINDRFHVNKRFWEFHLKLSKSFNYINIDQIWCWESDENHRDFREISMKTHQFSSRFRWKLTNFQRDFDEISLNFNSNPKTQIDLYD